MEWSGAFGNLVETLLLDSGDRLNSDPAHCILAAPAHPSDPITILLTLSRARLTCNYVHMIEPLRHCRPELNKSLWNVLEQVHRGGVYTAGNVYLENSSLVMETKAENMTIDQFGKPTHFYVSSGA